MQKAIVAKIYLKKTWLWLKNHWYIPVSFLAGCLVWFFYRQKAAAIFDNLTETRKAHKEEVRELERIHEKEVISRDENLENYFSDEEKLDEELRKQELAIAKEKAEREKELMKKEIHDIAKELAKKEHL